MRTLTLFLACALAFNLCSPVSGETSDTDRETLLQKITFQIWLDGTASTPEKELLQTLAIGSDTIAARALVQLGCLGRIKGDEALAADALKRLEGFSKQKKEFEGLSRLLEPAGQQRLIKVDLRDVLIPEAMRMIARSADRAVIIQGDIPEKKISLFLPEVDFDKVMNLLADMGSCKLDRLDNLVIVSPRGPGTESGGTSPDGTISIDLKDVSIRDALQLVAKTGKLNLVAHKSVHGKVTIQLNQVKPEQALEIIARASDLHLEEEGGYILAVPREKMFEVIGKSNSKQIRLNHITAEKAMEIIKEQTTCTGEPSNDNTQVLLRGDPSTLERAARILAELDKPAKPFTTNFRIWETKDGMKTTAPEFLALTEEKKLAMARVIARPRIITLPGSPAKISIDSDVDTDDKQARWNKIVLTADLLPLADGMIRFKTGFLIMLKSKDAKGVKETKRQGDSTYVIKPGATFGQDLETEDGTVIIEYTVQQTE